MKLKQASVQIACLAVLGWTANALAVDPSPLKNAYWRFEEGPAGQQVPYGANTIQDSSGDQQHSHCHDSASEAPISYHPRWSTEVPVNRMLRGPVAQSALSLRFDLWFYGAQLLGNDIWTNLTDINNPVFTDITIEAAFKADAIAPDGRYQGIIVKHGQASPGGHPPLVLKIRGDNGKLQIETVDNGLQVQDVESILPLVAGQWYYAAVVGTATDLKLYLDSGDGEGYVLQGTTPVTGGAAMVQHYLGEPGEWSDFWQDYLYWKWDTSWAVGRGCWNNSNADWFAGWIDEVRISNAALAVDQFLWEMPPPPNPADFDNSGVVDSTDRLILEACSTGPEIDYNPQGLPVDCSNAGILPGDDGKIKPDMDKDGDVDQSDYGLWQVWYTGG